MSLIGERFRYEKARDIFIFPTDHQLNLRRIRNETSNDGLIPQEGTRIVSDVPGVQTYSSSMSRKCPHRCTSKSRLCFRSSAQALYLVGYLKKSSIDVEPTVKVA